MNPIEVSVKKSFVGNSPNGLTFHWLRSIYFDAVEEAVDTAVRLVYSPLVLAASPETSGEVLKEVTYCREGFEEMMTLATKGLAPESPLPKRINVGFKCSYSTASNLGRVYEWLLRVTENEPAKAIFYAIRLVYFPAAFAASPHSVGTPQLQVERSRMLFEQKMKLAIWESDPTEEALIANRLDRTYLSPSSRELSNITPPPQEPEPKPEPEKEEADSPEPADVEASVDINQESAADEYDDDYVDVDRTQDTE
jgi:hypothetical protein